MRAVTLRGRLQIIWYVQRLLDQNVGEAKDLVLFLVRQIPGRRPRGVHVRLCVPHPISS